MKTQIFIVFVLILILNINIPIVLAQESDTSSVSGSKKQELQSQQQEDRISRLKTKTNKEIERRINSLNKLINRINEIKHLTTEQKSSLIAQIQTEITNLTDLKTKIDAASDSATLKTDVKSIVNSHRIYALFIPKIYILITSDKIIGGAEDKFTELANKLESRINEAKSKGKDVSSLETALNDMKNKIAEAKTQAQNAQNTVLPLTPAGFPDNKTALREARKMLQTARHALQKAKQDTQTIIQGLRKIPSASNDSSTPSTTSATQ